MNCMAAGAPIVVSVKYDIIHCCKLENWGKHSVEGT